MINLDQKIKKVSIKNTLDSVSCLFEGREFRGSCK